MTADPIGGVWTYALELARALESHGIQIALASMGARVTREQYQQVLARKNVRLFESRYGLEWMDDPWDDVDRAGDWLLQIAERTRADLIHLNDYSHAVLPWSAPVLVAAHSCVLSWWRAVKNEEAPGKYDEYRARVAAGLTAADLLVAPSIAMRDTLVANYNRRADCIVIRNARDSRAFSCGEKSSVVFSCGRVWDEAKNLRLLDKIAPHIAWSIAVAGDCHHPNGSTIALHNICCIGQIPQRELVQQLSRAAIFVLPARYEPFGLSALEAGLSGCALVLGDIPSLREIWHGSAIFVPPDHTSGFINALNGLIENPRRREDFGRRARARAIAFSTHKMANEYVGAYTACLRVESDAPAARLPLVFEEVAA